VTLPGHLAKSIATLDQLSRGRIEAGVGSGGPARLFAAFGVDPQRYAARFAEGIAVMKALWTEPRGHLRWGVLAVAGRGDRAAG